ncbi:MAG: YbaN family protein [Lysobacteraceae bacterium]
MDRLHRNRFVRWLWILIAWVALALGALGVVLPGLPTTPFVLLAAYAAARGSRSLQDWLHAHRLFGPMIRDWERHGAVSRRAKCFALITMLLCAVLMALTAPRWWMVPLGTGIMAMVGIWLWRRPEPPEPVVGVATASVDEVGGAAAATDQRSTRLP